MKILHPINTARNLSAITPDASDLTQILDMTIILAFGGTEREFDVITSQLRDELAEGANLEPKQVTSYTCLRAEGNPFSVIFADEPSTARVAIAQSIGALLYNRMLDADAPYDLMTTSLSRDEMDAVFDDERRTDMTRWIDAFSDELLMPAHSLRAGETPESVAQRFRVPLNVATTRLAHLHDEIDV